MKRKQQSIVRCSTCNELLTESDIKNLKRNGGICNWCHSWQHYNNGGGNRYLERSDISTWLNELRLGNGIRSVINVAHEIE